MPPNDQEPLPAGAIQPEPQQAAEPAPVAEAAPAETQLPLSAVLQLLDRQQPQAAPTPAARPQPLAEVEQFNRFVNDPAFAAQAMRQMSNGRLNPEDPVHVALAETELRNRAAMAQQKQEFKTELQRAIQREVGALKAAQQHEATQQAFEAELAKPVYQALDAEMGQQLANNVGMLMQQGRTRAQAIKETFGPVEKLLKARGPTVPNTPRVTPAGHSLNPPSSGAGAGAPNVGGRAGLNLALQNIRNGVRRS